MHTHIAFFFIKWGLVRNKGALPFCSLWGGPAKDETFIFSRSAPMDTVTSGVFSRITELIL